ncbi:hypothetical protein LSH36_138g00040 [Paralvinella palmiformis]|uniref:Uncharacterized protein n=1 Tax=Paralvinella palmiformis TaxID=53620 RepID=A0AAD9JVF1_9ANNE|nr:hypothetical protein LSH36_138g00040 [Paralvinella palmiformis]
MIKTTGNNGIQQNVCANSEITKEVSEKIDLNDRLLEIILVCIIEDEDVAVKLRGKLLKNENISVSVAVTSSSPKAKMGCSSKLENAFVVPLVSSRSLKNENYLSYYHDVIDASSGKNNTIAIRLPGVKDKDWPKYPRHVIRVQTSSSFHYNDNNMADCAAELVELCFSEMTKWVVRELAPKTDRLLTLEIDIRLPVENERDSRLETVMDKVTKQLRDPWTPIRQSFFRLFKAVNIRVLNIPKTNHLLLEIVFGKQEHIENMQKFCSSKKINIMFEECFRSLKTETDLQFTFCVNYQNENPDDAASLADNGNIIFTTGSRDCDTCGVDSLANVVVGWNRAKTLAGIIKKIVAEKSGYHPYDLFSQIIKNKGKVNIKDAQDDTGHNIIHLVVLSGRKEFLEEIFYAGIWDNLRSETIDPEKDEQYGGYTASGLAEKLLFRDIGPSVFEELEYYDELWMTMPPLHRACLRGKINYVRWICQTYSDAIHLRDSNGSTCILYACASGTVEIVELLITRGANPTDTNDRGEDGLLLAGKFAKSDMIHFLLTRFSFAPHRKDHLNHRTVDYPAINGDKKMMESFHKYGMPPDATTVSVAAKYQCIPMVQWLINTYCTDVSGKDWHGRTPFLNAAANGSVKLLVMLLDHGADMLDTDEDNRNCLHLAAECNHIETCRFLLKVAREKLVIDRLLNDKDHVSEKKQCIVVSGRDRGKPAWHYFLLKRSVEHLFDVTKKLGQIDLKKFGRILYSGFGQNPDKAMLKKIEEEMSMSLRGRGFPDMTPLALATYLDQTEVACLLIDEGARLDTTDYYNNTLLHLAAMRGNMKLVQRIYKDPKEALRNNAEGHSPVDIAQMNGHISVLNFLEGLKQMKHVEVITKFLEESKKGLDDERLMSLRSFGEDIRLYVIGRIRHLRISINGVLKDMGSGPIQEESAYEESQRRQAFAGLSH